MKTNKEIDEQIKKLKAVRPKIVPRSAFGDDNLAKLDAQVAVLEGFMDEDEICDTYENEVLQSALDAYEWKFGRSEINNLAEDWPLKTE
jgi:hypothetical protein